MSIDEVLTPVLLLLTFIGYVACLAHLFWVTAGLTVALGYLIFQGTPTGTANYYFWGSAVVAAVVVKRFLPKSPRFQGDGRKRIAQPRALPGVVIDGTNEMYWDGDPDLRTLRSVVDLLKNKNLAPLVFLDASTRHHLGDKSLDKKGFATALGLRQDRVLICPAQTEADAFILKYAKENCLPVVSNDRFSDRTQQAKGLKLIKGVIANGKPILHGI